MKIHILGGSGFVGKNIVSYLRKKMSDEIMSYSSKDCDLLSKESLLNNLSVNSDDVIVFCSSITRLIDNSINSFNKNVSMADNVASFIKENKVSKLIFLSTTDVYGLVDEGVVIDESTKTEPNDYYANSKLSSEFLLKSVCKELDISFYILRLSGVYGDDDIGISTMSKLVGSAYINKQITLFGDGSDLRDFVFVDDISRAIQIISENGSTYNSFMINMVTGDSMSIKDISELIVLNFEKKQNMKPDLIFKPASSNRCKDLVFNNEKISKVIPGFEMTKLRENIANYIDGFLLKKSDDNMMGKEIDLLEKYPKSKRDLDERAASKTEEQRSIARQFGKEFFDGDRNHGYGGFNYNSRFWSEVVKDFIEHYNLKPGSKILDVGCAKGFMLYDFLQAMPELEVRGVDISEYAIENSKEEVKDFLSVANANDLSEFKENEFDLVISINTVHNLEIDECKKAIQEIERIGKNTFITMDAWRTDDEEKRMKKWNLTAKTMMSVNDWKELFKEIGYKGDFYWFIP